jgi:hypothetical protein
VQLKSGYFMLLSVSTLKPNLTDSAAFISPGPAVTFIKPQKLYLVVQKQGIRI